MKLPGRWLSISRLVSGRPPMREVNVCLLERAQLSRWSCSADRGSHPQSQCPRVFSPALSPPPQALVEQLPCSFSLCTRQSSPFTPSSLPERRLQWQKPFCMFLAAAFPPESGEGFCFYIFFKLALCSRQKL